VRLDPRKMTAPRLAHVLNPVLQGEEAGLREKQIRLAFDWPSTRLARWPRTASSVATARSVGFGLRRRSFRR
jgi:hypothetical protein